MYTVHGEIITTDPHVEYMDSIATYKYCIPCSVSAPWWNYNLQYGTYPSSQ